MAQATEANTEDLSPEYAEDLSPEDAEEARKEKLREKKRLKRQQLRANKHEEPEAAPAQPGQHMVMHSGGRMDRSGGQHKVDKTGAAFAQAR